MSHYLYLPPTSWAPKEKSGSESVGLIWVCRNTLTHAVSALWVPCSPPSSRLLQVGHPVQGQVFRPQSGKGCHPIPLQKRTKKKKKKDIWQLPVYLVLSWSCPNNSNVCASFKILFTCCLYIGPFQFLALLIGGKSKL